MKTLRILGTRGIPAAHGGFETFAEQLANHLYSRGWRVIVYCQHEGTKRIWEDRWNGIERIHIAVKGDGSLSTIKFDWLATIHAAQHKDLCLTLGYNTAVFNIIQRMHGTPNVFNMDGIEWARAKWGNLAKIWFWLNDWAGCLIGNHLIADNPGIEKHLLTRVSSKKITMIPYGAHRVDHANPDLVINLGLKPKKYLTVIARAEPENSILEIVKSFSNKKRGVDLAILGNYFEDNAYHQNIKKVASSEVKFVGAIYDTETVRSLRFHSLAYLHGHQVGGTNPSLVEAMAAHNAIIAHDNIYNKWVAGSGAIYFNDELSLSHAIDQVLTNENLRINLQNASINRFEQSLTWPIVLDKYESLLSRWT